MAPTGPDPAWTDGLGNMAPAGVFPADITGSLKELQDTWLKGREYVMFDPRRVELGKKLFTLNIEEKYHIGIVGFTASRRGVVVNRRNFKNVPPTGVHIRDKHGFWTETYFFEDGKDNLGT